MERVETLTTSVASAAGSATTSEQPAPQPPTLVEIPPEADDVGPSVVEVLPPATAPLLPPLEPFDWQSKESWQQYAEYASKRIDWASGTAGLLAGLAIAGLAGVCGR